MTMIANSLAAAGFASHSLVEKAGDNRFLQSGCPSPYIIVFDAGAADSSQSRLCVILFDENTILLAGFGKAALPSALSLVAALVLLSFRHRWAARPFVLLACRLGATSLLVAVAAGEAQAGNNFPGTTITGTSGSLVGTNVGATGQTGEPTTFGGGSLNTMWYSWTAPANGTLTVETCSNTQTDFDTTLKTYTGAAVNALTTIASNDDACATTFNTTFASRNTLTVTSGTVYRIQVDGYGSATGNFLLSWDFAANVAQFALTKTASVSSISAPGTITYTIRVENTGNTTLNGLTISDALTLNGSAKTLTSGPTYTSGDTNSNGQINTTETWFYTATYAVTQADIDTGGSFSNTATFDTAQTAPSTSAAAVTSITQSPSLSINKTAVLLTDLNSDGQAGAGDVVRYTYAVTNTGNVTVANVAVAETSFNGSNGTPSPGSETLTGDVAPLADSTDAAGPGIWGSLRPGDTVSFTADYSVNQQDVDQLQ